MPAVPPILQSLLVLLSPFALLLLEGKKLSKIPSLLGLHAKNFLGQAGGGVTLFFVTFGVLLVQTIVFTLFGVADGEKVSGVLQQQSFLTLFAIVFIAPVGEELLFRGYLQKKISSLVGGSDKFGIIITSILFAALHAGFGSVSELAGALTAALIFGWYVSKNKIILPVIIAHALVNVYAVGVSNLAK